jgi:23S rRNA (cytidine1920-2'-O)/16S rRNA (cytidine1409-2'-O)-methyltransferase
VTVRERTNVRTLSASDVGGAVDLVVADLSFISLRIVRDALIGACADPARLLLLVKPQFELPREWVPPGRGGVVSDPRGWREAMRLVADAYRAAGSALAGAQPSVLRGPRGNAEFFLHLERPGHDVGDATIDHAVRLAEERAGSTR